MSPIAQHPHLLLWYVSGTLAPREREEIDRHLAWCEDCRLEASNLASMMRSVQSQSRTDHLAASELSLYEETGSTFSPARRAPIESHLGECASCREDLAILGRARALEGAGAVSSSRRRFLARHRAAGWLGAAAAAAALLVLVSLVAPPGPPERSAALAEPMTVLFPSPVRGVEAARILEGQGPWEVHVALPFDASEGTYRITVHRGDAAIPGVEVDAVADQDKCLTVILPGLPAPGRYEMALRRETPGPEESYFYPFRLIRPTGPKPAH